MHAEQFGDLLEGKRRISGGWIGKCPAHDDSTPSLSVSEGKDGRVLFNCHAHCKSEDILQAMGLDWSDVNPPREKHNGSDIVATYDYRDERGTLLYQAVRLFPKSFRQRKPSADGWEWKLGDVQRVPYRLPELLSADATKWVFIVEGEKDVESLRAWKLVATCNSGGAGNWSQEFGRYFKGRKVAIIPDNDAPGREHAKQVAKSLEGHASEVKVLELPGLEEKGDFSDWARAGGDVHALRELLEGSDSVQRRGFVETPVRIDLERCVRLEQAKNVVPFNVTFLDDCCEGVHPNDLVVISAATGCGKTTLATMLAEAAARNGRRVHFFALEAHENEIEQRLLYREASGLAWRKGVRDPDMSFARWMYGRYDLGKYEDEARESIKRELKTLNTYYRSAAFTHEHITEQFKEIRNQSDLIILDHLHYVDYDGPNENRELKKVITAIRSASLEIGVPVIVIAHLRKKDRKAPRLIPDGDDIHGSSDISKVATKIAILAPARDTEVASNTPGVSNTLVQVVKNRFDGADGYCGVLQFHMSGMRYAPKYKVARLLKGGTEVEYVDHDQMPRWAKNAQIHTGIR